MDSTLSTTPSPVVRIVLVQRPERVDSHSVAPVEGDTVAALSGLGGDVELEIVRSAEDCHALVGGHDVDLVILDCGLDAFCARVQAGLEESGPPVIAIARDEPEHILRECLRRGAAECIRMGGDAARLVSDRALEHMRRWHRAREHGAAERRFDELERYNEQIINNLNSALVVVDTRGRISSANPTAEVILGASSEGLVNTSIYAWIGDSDAEGSMIGLTLREGRRFKGAETTLRRADGRVIPIGISCTPLHDAEERMLGAVAIFQDLSEIKQLRSQALQTEKMASIGQLAAGVAHEINNPMGFIHANLFQMAEYLGDIRQVWTRVGELQKALHSDDMEAASSALAALETTARDVDIDFVLSDFAKAVRESQEGSERIRHIVQDLRDFSHHDTGERQLADINHCVDSTASIVWTMMKHSVVLVKDYRDLPQIHCYPMQLKQVFMNLLVNAYQAIEESAADTTGPGEIRIRTEPRGEGVLVVVQDTGVGIPDENLERIFDPFFTTKSVGVGTGLGLSTSYSIMQRHGGTLRAYSPPGEGTRFEVWLPRGNADAEGAA